MPVQVNEPGKHIVSNQVEFLVSRAGRWAFIGIYRDSWKSNALNFSYSILLDDNVDRADRGGSSAVYQSDSPQDQAVERALPSPREGAEGMGSGSVSWPSA